MAEARSTSDASVWKEADAERYAKVKHGPDGKVFLDPVLASLIGGTRLSGQRVLDIGCGAGAWTEFALQQGATHATAFDLNEAMVQKARTSLSPALGSDSRVTLLQADAANLPKEIDESTYSFLMSILVGCNLPSGTFEKHFAEAYRVASRGARFVVAAPHSLSTLFTTEAGSNIDLQNGVDTLWDKGERDPKKLLRNFPSVLRATFILDEGGKPVLVTENNNQNLKAGDPIIRIIPGPLAVDNNYHTAQEYVAAAEAAGWNVTRPFELKFPDENARQQHNTQVLNSDQPLGPQYVDQPPFLVLNLRK